jgi:hypothetical protein
VRTQLTGDLFGSLGTEASGLPVVGELPQFAVRIGRKVVALPLGVDELRVPFCCLLGPRGAADAESAGDRGRRRREQEHTVRRTRSGEPEQQPSRRDDPVVGLDRP